MMSFPIALSSAVAQRTGLLALGLATLLPMLAGSMVNMVLPTLEMAFAVSFASLHWVLVAYVLAITCLSVVAGGLGDRLGRRRLLCCGMGLFVLASMLCAMAPGIGWLIGARALQGVGAACMLSLALALVGQLVPPRRRGVSMGLLGTLSACGTALGPSCGGLLIDGFGWQAPFLLLIPLGLLALGAALVGLPMDEPEPKGEPIALGSLLALTVMLLCYGLLLSGGFEPWLVPIGVLAAAIFVRSERSVRSPLLPLSLLSAPMIWSGLLGSSLVASVMVLTLLVGPFYLQGVFGLGLAEAGLWISGGPLMAAFTGIPTGWLVDRLGAKALVQLGLGTMLLAILGLVTLPVGLGPLSYLLPILLLTAGYAVFQTANNGSVIGAASESSRGALAGLLTLARNLGQLTGAAGLGGLFAALVGTENLADSSSSALRSGMQLSFVAAGLLIGLALWLIGRVHGPER